MDIEKSFNDLICKYNVDSHFPGFKKYLCAKNLIEQYCMNLSKEGKTIVLVGCEQTSVTWFQRNICQNSAIEWVICNLNLMEEMQDKNDEDFCYLIVSYAFKEELQVKLYEKGKNVINIYEFFESKQIYFEHDFYDIYGRVYHNFRTKEVSRDYKYFDLNEIFFWHRRSYELEEDSQKRKVYLEKVIFDCAYAKDFILLKLYINKYMAENDECENYKNFYQEVEILLDNIRKYLKKRNQKDCFMIWLDALEYGDDEDMAFLHGLEDKAFVFDNIYTVTPYTRPTFKTLFGAARVIEEQSFKITRLDEDNSEFIRGLIERGYSFKYYGIVDLLGRNYNPPHFYSTYTVVTQSFWDILCDIVVQEDNERGFFVLHELAQTHNPYVSMGMKGTIYSNYEVWPGHQDESEVIRRNRQALESRKYVDEQLCFWNSILPECMYKIYMSDHGHDLFGRFHPIMKISQADIAVRHCDSLLSYYDFGRIMLYILDHADLDDKKFDSESIIVQDVDYYGKEFILDFIKQKNFSPDNLIGYQGVVTKEDMLLSYRHGVEYYQKHSNDGTIVTDARLDYLRTLLSKSQINIYEEDKFKYSRIVWEADKRCAERTREIEDQKKEILNNIFKDIPTGKIIAIRGGGIHTLRLLMVLDSTQRARVNYIIDKNELCLAGKMGIKVLNPETLHGIKIDYFVVSSYGYRKQWKKELTQLNCGNVIEIYEQLEKEGIICNKEFYKKDFVEEDFSYGI